MEEFIAYLNVQHFKKLLSESLDDEKRSTIIKLLAVEEKRLSALKFLGKSANRS